MEGAWERTRRDWRSWRKRMLWPGFGLAVLGAAAYLGYQLLWGSDSEGRSALTAFAVAVAVFVVAGTAAFLAIWMTSPHRVLHDAVVNVEGQIVALQAGDGSRQPSPEEKAKVRFVWQLRVFETEANTLSTLAVQGDLAEPADVTVRERVWKWRKNIYDLLVATSLEDAALWQTGMDKALPERKNRLNGEIIQRRALLDRLITNHESQISLMQQSG